MCPEAGTDMSSTAIRSDAILTARVRDLAVCRPLIPEFFVIPTRIVIWQRRGPLDKNAVISSIFDMVEFTNSRVSVGSHEMRK
jgi:hypothetical protein